MIISVALLWTHSDISMSISFYYYKKSETQRSVPMLVLQSPHYTIHLTPSAGSWAVHGGSLLSLLALSSLHPASMWSFFFCLHFPPALSLFVFFFFFLSVCYPLLNNCATISFALFKDAACLVDGHNGRSPADLAGTAVCGTAP